MNKTIFSSKIFIFNSFTELWFAACEKEKKNENSVKNMIKTFPQKLLMTCGLCDLFSPKTKTKQNNNKKTYIQEF